MISAPPSPFSSKSLTPALQSLCAILDDRADMPRPGGFSEVARKNLGETEIRQMLEAWIGEGKEVSGWILTTEALHMFPDTPGLPTQIPLHAELYRASDRASLNLRHTPQGWIWEELQSASKNDDGEAFTEEKTVMIDPAHAKGNESLRARYEVEWKLVESPCFSTPASFRPTRSRFIGWQ